MKTIQSLSLSLCILCVTGAASAQDPKYKADVPESVTTPDIVKTESLGELKFFDGMPSKESVEKLYDNLDLVRGVTAFLDGIPVAAIQGFAIGLPKVGVHPNEIGITETLNDARSIWLTPNTTTIYVTSIVDASDGPVVLDVPPGILALLDDAAFQFVANLGPLGADKGKGGKYLLLPPGYKGDVPEGYFVLKSKSYSHWFLGRLSPDENGKTEAVVAAFKKVMNIYPLSEAGNPPKEKFVNLSGVKYNTVHANNFEFFEEVNQAVQREPATAFSPELVGAFHSIGIRKGIPFEPDERMRKILTEAAAIGNATARAISYAPRDPEVYFYEDRQWNSPFQRQSHEFLVDGVRILDDRSYFHYVATGITPAMTSPPVGSGSVYALTARDAKGRYLDGGKNYTVTLPAPIPAKNFWSFMAYSGQTRSILESDQKSGGLDSKSPDLAVNKDGSVTVWVGPEAPKGKDGNWIQTMPGKSYNMMLRLYGPLEPWFDKSWRPGDFELVD